MKKVSIIVPFYNNKDTLNKCIDSILASTYTNIEVLCVSDGGTDGSEDVVRAYTDPRVKLIISEHGGVSKTRNVGIKNATGDYLEFCDSDDSIAPTMIEKLVKEIEKNDADMAVCAFSHPVFRNYLGNQILDITKIEDALKFYQATFASQVPWNKIYKKECVKESFDIDLKFAEDELYGLSNLFNLKKVVSITDELYDYYVAPPKDTSSGTITAMANQNNFWETNSTFWYKRVELMPKFKAVLDKLNLGIYYNDFLYSRAYSFILWGPIIMEYTGAPLFGIKKDVNNIMRNQVFLDAMETKRKYNLELVKYQEDQYTNRIDFFIENLINFQHEYASGREYRPYIMGNMLFVGLFMKSIGEVSTTFDELSRAYIELKANQTNEAKAVNEILKRF